MPCSLLRCSLLEVINGRRIRYVFRAVLVTRDKSRSRPILIGSRYAWSDGRVSDQLPPVSGRPPHRYHGCTELAGPVSPELDRLTYRRLIPYRKRLAIVGLLALNAISVLSFMAWLLLIVEVRLPVTLSAAASWTVLLTIVGLELVRLVQTAGICWFAGVAVDPVPMRPQPGLRVAVLTTIVPDQEPLEMVVQTLAAMRRLVYDGPVDVWILDEGDDPDVRQAADELGVWHFSRRGRSELNTASGEFRARTKAGNHNAWRVAHADDYDVVAQMDPDHLPSPLFLERTLGYLRDPDVAFVVAPQVYGNANDSFVTRAAAAQGYVFTGIVQRGGNGVGAPLLIGTNHVYRMNAWNQIHGYQDSIIEDHLTGMVVHGSRNPATGRRWAGVYTPDILAVGEGPSTWNDFYRQQNRWASGVWQILLKRSGLRSRLTHRQQLAYAFLQSFYPAVGLCWLIGNGATLCYLTGLAQHPVARYGWVSWVLWCSAILTWLLLLRWLRQWYLHPDERGTSVLRPWLATILTAPVYTRAALLAALRRSPAYAVTGKGRLRNQDTMATFRTHLAWAVLISTALMFSVITGSGSYSSHMWAVLSLMVCLPLPALSLARQGRSTSGAPARWWTRGVRSHIHRPQKRSPRPRQRQDRPEVMAAVESSDLG